MGTVREICVRIQFSPKCKKLMGKIAENIEGKLFEGGQKIIDNYTLFLQLWDEHLMETLESETKSTIIGCQN